MNASTRKWFNEHVKVIEPITEEQIKWIRSRPVFVQQVMRDYPPECVVKRVIPCRVTNCDCMPMGAVGAVAGFIDNSTSIHIWHVKTEFIYILPRHHFKVIGYWNGLTREKIAEILDS